VPPFVHSANPLKRFKSATITFTTAYTVRYDQAGILLCLRNPGETSSSSSSSSSPPPHWIKAGIEFYQGKPLLSTVCCDAYADWSVARLPSREEEDAVTAGKASVTLLLQKEYDENGVSLWVYHVADDADGTKTPMRECCWLFAERSDGKEDWELEVCGLVARPDKDAKGALEAEFEKFDVQWDE
jgi:regulation of enolase protein 1 (concanavalin A-like superfamily)